MLPSVLLYWTLSLSVAWGSTVQLDSNGYRGVVIAIHPRVPESPALISSIKDMFAAASSYLFAATGRRAYFQEVRILVPNTWRRNNSLYSRPRTEKYTKASVIVSDPSCKDSTGPPAAPYTLTDGHCGQPGRYTHMSPRYLLEEQGVRSYGPRGRVLVHSWATLRWGVFSEFDTRIPFYRSSTGQIEATRCSKDLPGSLIDRVTGEACDLDPLTGLPTESCVFVLQDNRATSASIMYQPSLPESDRIARMRQAAEIFLVQILEQDSLAGIVRFDSSAVILQHLTLVSGLAVRTELARKLPTQASGGTNICEGLNKGFEVLREDDQDVAGTEIILLTDGEDSNVGSCLQTAQSSGVTIHTVALGPSADPLLEQFALRTGGQRFSSSDRLDSTALIDAFSDFSSESGDDSVTTIQVLSVSAVIGPGARLRGTVTLDSTVGNSTVFTVTWQSSPPDIQVDSPRGDAYNSSHLDPQQSPRVSRLRVPGVAEAGSWSYSVLNTDSSQQTFTLTVTSSAAHECVSPITVTGGMNVTATTYPQPITITVRVSQGDRPVVNAIVVAIMELANGSKIRLPLQDNGIGADIFRNDGVYSGLFFSYGGDGRYSLKFEVMGTGGTVQVWTQAANSVSPQPEYIDGNGTLHPSAPSGRPGQNGTALGNFSRSGSGGTVTVSQVPPAPRDQFPPGRVTDLQAALLNRSVELLWTAPGDDYYTGTVSRYDLRVHPSPHALRDNFTACAQINTSSVVILAAGQPQSLRAALDELPAGNRSVLYFALRAQDEAGQESPTSIITQVSVSVYTPPAPPAPQPAPQAGTGADRCALWWATLLLLGGPLACVAVAICWRRRRRQQQAGGLTIHNAMAMAKH
ncbi:calcium-activated chloride channel regulator 3A-1-like isoform X2 [Lepisosteus oculatus]|uniref:calcium-activated chloride channel regulator 3A-1-like isoform X2 n=1 Tax=Lepisosteus oculatus TaxID=7918 RepID=UPI003711EA2F